MCLRALETALGQLQKSRVIRAILLGNTEGKDWMNYLMLTIIFWVRYIFSFNNLFGKMYCTYIDELFSIENYQSALTNI